MAMMVSFLVALVHLCIASSAFEIENVDKTYKEACMLNSECDSSVGLTCSVFRICECGAFFQWKDGKCQNKFQHNFLENCTKDSDCDSRLVCKENRCMCGPGSDWSVYECVDEKKKRRLDESCKLPSDCFRNLNCEMPTLTCRCVDSTAWNEKQQFCVKEYNQPCGSTSVCLSTTECRNNVCTCPGGSEWTGSTCTSGDLKPKEINEDCTDSSDCSGNLDCEPQTKTCQCPGDTDWNDKQQKCVEGYSQQCDASSTCRTNMVCKNGVCTCPALSKWTGTACSYAILISVVLLCIVLIAVLSGFFVYRNVSNRRRRNAEKSAMTMSSRQS